MQWFAVKLVFQHRKLSRLRAVYEERIVLYRAAKLATALAKAKVDADKYVEGNPSFRLIYQPTVFVLHKEDELFAGAEVWSTLLKGASEPKKFISDRYKKFELGVGS